MLSLDFTPEAFLFDMNGTMIDDMGFHLIAWANVLNNELKANLTNEQVKLQMYGKNEELLGRVFGKGHFTQAQMDAIAMDKEKAYQQAYKPHLKLIEGLAPMLDAAKAKGIKMAIGTAAIPFNIDFVVDNLKLRSYFPVIVNALDVVHSKPHPDVFLQCAQQLGVNPARCIVFEDAPKGIEAALNAGMKAIVLTTLHEPQDFAQYSNVLAAIKDYTDPAIQELLQR
ncbi:haloacid dehalogenase superfamily, subfamily IA, variant 3 with third motif having DD or ED/beta-phosphoglucomutase family hydrolase [Chitinophaga costaii]|uniref:Haloacid dehalogenase superfamily, subfamily IA, variant 3 with third motif having DD or ED/beta-phosphoglucomutase family hydrolase n=1 Tax=Chitinophaga costaii TaxID=1335309 RepID=A0A1C4CPN1_9BACT|nr:HAD family phosphatase [Chitinophaga costaii]PUZ27007.1 HAD family phosphatase [Chitinophaga costaii]SCC21032.1 haloacid dehalogenase superfamily, subfamily IA, variant 3 with third motif having DD or ED/beta-phosphoglucomutase family hydrolase [Chitinophaga costaii]